MDTQKFTATFTDISHWTINEWLQTGGIRKKCWVINPKTNKLCFFKESHHNYNTEFWMEIIASKVGQSLGLNMLDYNIAEKDSMLGCLSDKMTNDEERLSELVNFLVGYDKTYNPETKIEQKRYTLSFVKKALKFYKLDMYLSRFIEVIVFDSLIGNQDRHQGNWGFITPNYINNEETISSNILLKLLGKLIKPKDNIISSKLYKFSPIYDSGSCLGRENDEKKIGELLNDNIRLNAYINRCKAELRWDGPKIEYFTLLKNLLNDHKYKKETLKSIKKITHNFNENTIKDIIWNIDNNLPLSYSNNKLTQKRKEFVLKLLTLRHETLCGIINEQN